MGVIETTTEYIVVRMATRWSGKRPIEPLTLPKVGGSSRWSATSRNPLSQQLCFLIGGQPHSPSATFVARPKPPPIRRPCTVQNLPPGARPPVPSARLGFEFPKHAHPRNCAWNPIDPDRGSGEQ